MARPLTQRQSLFVEAYLGAANRNAAEASRIAGYKGDNHALAVIGARNLTKADIRSEIDARTAELKQEIGPDYLIAFLKQVMEASVEDVFEIGEYGTPRIDVRKAKLLNRLGIIETLQVDRSGVKVKQYSKMEAVDRLAKMLGLYVDRKELTGAGGGPVVIEVVKFGAR